MQTFLPYASFVDSAKCLDNKRLGKQRVECLQILKALLIPEYGWKHHPAVKMWGGHEWWLIDYGCEICYEWILLRGFKDTCLAKIQDFRKVVKERPRLPDWLGNEAFHNSHKSNLLRKFPEHYNQFNWNVPIDLDYWWPTKNLTISETMI